MDGHQTGFPHHADAPIGAFFRHEQDGQRWQHPDFVSDTVHSPPSGATAYFGSHGPTFPINSTVVDFNTPPYHPPLSRHEMPAFFDDPYLTSEDSSSSRGSQHGSVPVYPIGFEDEAIATPQIMFDNLRVGPPMKAKIGSDVLVSLTTQRRTRPAQHKCDLCPSDFTTKYNLRNHMKSHYAIRDYRCEGCQQTFGIRHVFKRHQRTCKRCV